MQAGSSLPLPIMHISTRNAQLYTLLALEQNSKSYLR